MEDGELRISGFDGDLTGNKFSQHFFHQHKFFRLWYGLSKISEKANFIVNYLILGIICT